MSDGDAAIVENIRANAVLVVAVARDEMDLEVRYDENGVKWLDGYIERNRAGWPRELREKLPSTLGSFLGECIIASHGGEWACVDGRWGVRFDAGSAAFPFAKVAKQLDGGPGDSVLGFFRAIPAIFGRGHGPGGAT